MNRRHLLGIFVDNPEALFRKTRAKHKKRSSTIQQEASSNQEDHRNLSFEFEAMANKSIHEFSAPTTDNIRTGPAAEIDRNFELKPGLSTWCNPTSSVGRHTKMLVVTPIFYEQNRMHKRLICAPGIVAHISRQISNVPLQCLLHSET